jgi:hypothetical protein
MGRVKWRNPGSFLPRFFSSLEFLRDLPITKIVFVEVKQVQAPPVLHFALTDIVQVWLPVPVVDQILSYMRGQKDVPAIAAIQHSLGHINSGAGYVRFVVDIGDPINRAAVNPHPYLKLRMILQCSANFQSASHRLFRAAKEKERHPIAGWHSDKFVACLRSPKTFRCADDLIQVLQYLNLLVHEQFRVTDNVD